MKALRKLSGSRVRSQYHIVDRVPRFPARRTIQIAGKWQDFYERTVRSLADQEGAAAATIHAYVLVNGQNSMGILASPEKYAVGKPATTGREWYGFENTLC